MQIQAVQCGKACVGETCVPARNTHKQSIGVYEGICGADAKRDRRVAEASWLFVREPQAEPRENELAVLLEMDFRADTVGFASLTHWCLCDGGTRSTSALHVILRDPTSRSRALRGSQNPQVSLCKGGT